MDHVRVESKQYPLVTAHALNIHKAQGSTKEYMAGDMDRITKTVSRTTPIYVSIITSLWMKLTNNFSQITTFPNFHECDSTSEN